MIKPFAGDVYEKIGIDHGSRIVIELDRKRLMQSSVQAQADALRQQIITEQSTLADIQRRLDDLDRSATDSSEIAIEQGRRLQE